MPTPRTLPEAIVARMAQTNDTAASLADHLGVAQPTVSRWRSGQSTPADALITPLAKWLKMSPKAVGEMADRSRVVASRAAGAQRRRMDSDVAALDRLSKQVEQVLANQATIMEMLAVKQRR